MDKIIIDHFRKNDPVLYRVIGKIKPLETFSPPKSNFERLCREIINQQLSEKAGDTIYGRFLTLFGSHEITPARVLTFSDESLRNVGMSWSKVRYIKGLAEAVKTKAIGLGRLGDLGDEDVIIELTKVKGIGRWTAEMFLMFSLGREDVFSHGDLGLRNAIKKLYSFKKEPTRKQIEKLAKRWIPYRTYACRLLWRSLEL